jgi:hypothetical protein
MNPMSYWSLLTLLSETGLVISLTWWNSPSSWGVVSLLTTPGTST